MLEGQDQLCEGAYSLTRRLYVSPKPGDTCDKHFIDTYCEQFGGDSLAASNHFDFLANKLPKDGEYVIRGNEAFAKKRISQDPQNLSMIQDGDLWVVYHRMPSSLALVK